MELIVESKRIIGRVAVFDLARADGAPLPAWTPGSHVEVAVPVGGETVLRHYSLCGRPGSPGWRIAVQRQFDGRGGSAVLVDRVAAGERLTVEGPRNHFPFRPVAGARILFLAGGIGITSIWPMAAEAEARGLDWRLIVLARRPGDAPLSEEIAGLPAERVTWHLSEERGRIDLRALVAGLGERDHVFACGPLRMLDDLETLGAGAPWRLSLERFRNAGPLAPAPEERAFEVVLARRGTTHRVEPGASILEVLRRDGVSLTSSCREGVCGTCEQFVVEGEPLHRDAVLSPEERASGETMMICVSRAKGERIVLDL
jgi:ferredoxin-NADP reductase